MWLIDAWLNCEAGFTRDCMMAWRTIPRSNKSLEDMLKEGLLSKEDVEAERAVRLRIRQRSRELREQADRIDDEETRALALSGGR